MRNIKIEHNLVGKDFWPNIGYVDVKGIDSAQQRDEDASDLDQEQVIQSWADIAVLKVSPRADFKLGFIQGNSFEFLSETIETDPEGRFGVRLGNKDTRFFALPTSLDTELVLELIDTVNEDDSSYQDLPLY